MPAGTVGTVNGMRTGMDFLRIIEQWAAARELAKGQIRRTAPLIACRTVIGKGAPASRAPSATTARRWAKKRKSPAAREACWGWDAAPFRRFLPISLPTGTRRGEPAAGPTATLGRAHVEDLNRTRRFRAAGMDGQTAGGIQPRAATCAGLIRRSNRKIANPGKASEIGACLPRSQHPITPQTPHQAAAPNLDPARDNTLGDGDYGIQRSDRQQITPCPYAITAARRNLAMARR